MAIIASINNKVLLKRNMNITLPKLVKSIRGCMAHVRTSASKNDKGQMETHQDWSLKTDQFELVMRNKVSFQGSSSKKNFSCESSLSNMRAYIKMPHSNALVIKGPKHTKMIQGDNSFVRLSPGVTNYIVTNSENKFPEFSASSTMLNDREIEDANPRSAEDLKRSHNIARSSSHKVSMKGKKTPPKKEEKKAPSKGKKK